MESFHSHHAPLGAFASFTVGLVGAPGGFGHALKGPAKQNVYVGWRRAGELWQLLPFYVPPKSNASAFTGEASAGESEALPIEALAPEAYTRQLGLATDTWSAGAFQFRIYTPFGPAQDPVGGDQLVAKERYAPVIAAELSFDNSTGTSDVEIIFGLSESDAQLYPLLPERQGCRGFAAAGRFGFAASVDTGAMLKQGFSLFAPNPEDFRGLHVLGNEAGLILRVPAGSKGVLPLSLGFFESGRVTTGIETQYAYTQWFSNIEEVLLFGLARLPSMIEESLLRDAELERSALSLDQRFLVAQAVHSYYGSTQMLLDQGRPLWVVNEGEYRMVNTFDLTVDHLFFELAWHPWAVRNSLELFAERYCYRDDIKGPDGRVERGGVSFTHDMGVANHFTEPGRSSYECDNLHGCFSHMTMEQLLNWVLCACSYAWRTEDWAWLEGRQGLLLECLESMERRDDPDEAQRDGIMKWDSTRCATGSEITTYDSLDVSLGQARNNLYLCGKALGAWMLLEKTFVRLGNQTAAARSCKGRRLSAAGLCARFDAQAGFFPAVFEKGNRSHIIPAVEGLVYPLYLGFNDLIAECGELLELYRVHLKNAFVPGVCIDSISGGWKMSSTSRNTWFSKIALSQYVVRSLFAETLGEVAGAPADKVHADWQRRPGCGAFAMCDQIFSDTGVTCGSRYYPRGVTTWLWLSEA